MNLNLAGSKRGRLHPPINWLSMTARFMNLVREIQSEIPVWPYLGELWPRNLYVRIVGARGPMKTTLHVRLYALAWDIPKQWPSKMQESMASKLPKTIDLEILMKDDPPFTHLTLNDLKSEAIIQATEHVASIFACRAFKLEII
jgi:hypothetical protein